MHIQTEEKKREDELLYEQAGIAADQQLRDPAEQVRNTDHRPRPRG